MKPHFQTTWQVQFCHGSAPWPCVSPAVGVQPPTDTDETERSCLQEGGASWQYGNISGQLLLDFLLWNQDSLEKKKKQDRGQMVVLRKASFKKWDSMSLFNTEHTLSSGVLGLSLATVLQLWNCKAGIFIVMLGREQRSWLRRIQIHDKCELIETLSKVTVNNSESETACYLKCSVIIEYSCLNISKWFLFQS